MDKRLKVKALMVSCLFILGVASGVYAQGMKDVQCDMPCKDKVLDKAFDELKLSSEQREKVKKQREESKVKRDVIREKMKQQKTALKEEINKPTVDKNKLNSIVAETKNLINQQLDLYINQVLGLKDILTPEQFKTWQAKIDEQKDKKQKMIKEKQAKVKDKAKTDATTAATTNKS